MMPRRAAWLVAALLAPAISACAGDPGEVMVVLETDLAVPKDIEAISVEVVAGGEVQFAAEFPTPGAELRLPGTLGVVLHEEATLVTFRATAWKDGAPRIVRQAVTRAPVGRVAALRLPLSWLCAGPVGANGEGACPGAGSDDPASLQTCHRGACVPAYVDPEALPDYAPEAIFGGGSGAAGEGRCYDVSGCFEGAEELTPVGPGCTVAAPREAAVAVRTEGDGVCGERGCLVPLDAGALGSAAQGRLALPRAVCDRVAAGQAMGVATSQRCAPRPEEEPICGPWSLSGPGAGPDPALPLTLAAGQRHPRAIALHGDHVYWTNAGTGAADGEVKRARKAGGAPQRLATGQASPSGLAVIEPGAGALTRVYWINEGAGTIFGALADGGAPGPSLLVQQEGTRGALAAAGGVLHWGTTGGVIFARPAEDGQVPAVVAVGQEDPVAITVAPGAVLWIDRGAFAVRALVGGLLSTVASLEGARVGLAADATHAYWTEVGEGTAPGTGAGRVMRARWSGGGGAPEVIAAGQPLPYAVAVDATSVYWTNKGDGTVARAPKQGGAPQVIAAGQENPVAIAVDAASVYWANAGTSEANHQDGTIRRASR